MKEVTYADWIQNPTPRLMWVWDEFETEKAQRKVAYVIKPGYCTYPVLTVTDECMYETYLHCAEIESSKPRRFTYRELSIWLQEKPTREYKYLTSDYICHSYDYLETNQDKEVHEDIRIREGDEDWHIPFKENE